MIGVPRTLRGRLTLWYAGLLAAALLAMGTTAWIISGLEDEPPGSPIALAEGPDPAPGRVLLAFALGIPPVLAAAALGGGWITRRALRPLEDVVTVARTLDPARVDARIAVPAGAAEEIHVAADSINAMLDRIQHGVEGMRRFTADASHELRTPLAAARADLEIDLRRERTAAEHRETITNVLGEVERMSRMVESLLALARSDAGELLLRREPVDLAEVARDAAARVAKATGRTIPVEAAAAHVVGDPDWLSRAVSNLIENASRYSPAGAPVSVAVGVRDARAEVVVDDGGRGIDEASRARVFERFFRGAEHTGSTEGAGLGLPLSREIARRHEGDVSLERSPLGGLRATLSLPAASS